MTRAADFTSVVRSGRRARSATLVVHHRTAADPQALPVAAIEAATAVVQPPVVGFVVSRAVGISVVRHRVTRRLRARVRPLLPLLAPGTSTVVRALPAAATATSDELAADLDHALTRLGLR